MWEAMTRDQKIKCVLEEAYVIALERKVLPLMYGHTNVYTSSRDAFRCALMRICTNLCSGWFREFATTNYVDIFAAHNPRYVEDFMEKVDRGMVQEASDGRLILE